VVKFLANLTVNKMARVGECVDYLDQIGSELDSLHLYYGDHH
jgi:hypothetical protein